MCMPTMLLTDFQTTTYLTYNIIHTKMCICTRMHFETVPQRLQQMTPLSWTINYNWRAPWKNRISSISMKLRKSLVKPVTWQNISSCSVLSPEIVMHDAFNVILWTSTDICVVVHDDLGWKNRTTRCNRFWWAGCSRLEYVDIRSVY